MKRAVKCTAAALAALSIAVFGACISLCCALPDEITAYGNDSIIFNHFSTLRTNDQIGLSDKASPAMSVSADSVETKLGDVTLCNIIPVKSVIVHRTEKKYAIPCGTLFGIKFYAKGAAVVNCCTVNVNGYEVDPAHDCGLQTGDAILRIDGCEITSCKDVERLTSQSGGAPLHLECMRGNEIFETDITPAICNGTPRLGLWIKDSAAGLGTMTFYDPESGRFASLGHGICDGDSGELLALDHAQITPVEFNSISKGSDGLTGSINGYFSDGEPIGHATLNSEIGLYGTLSDFTVNREPIEIANIQEVHKGHAQILCTIDDGEPELYDIMITSVCFDSANKTKNIQIEATDKRLLDKTGGIVQGMSGSPILQNGKLVGAVTHVLVTNSAKGYGIFAQNMFDEMEKAQN